MALMRIFLSVLLILWLGLAAQAEGRRVILVLDASGSMWGQIDGDAKMSIAKDVVGKVVSGWKAEDELGLVAYGHRVKGACDDIETLIEPGQLDSNTYMSAVAALNPKGKTPMTQAVRQAAEALKFTEKEATVILVSDGIETCDPNPCAVAEELERLGVGLTVHTVGFGLDDQGAVAQLKCLAEKTGGISILASNADELESALTKTVEAKVEEPALAVIEFNLIGRIGMAEGVALPNGYDSAAWEILTSNNGEVGEYVRTDYGSAIQANIEQPGKYFAKISVDVANILVPFEIVAGQKTELLQNLDAGLITFKGQMDEATPLNDDGAAWQLLGADGKWITTKYGSQAGFFANAGTYNIKLKLGTAEVMQDVVFVAGKTEEKSLTLGGGVIDVSGVFVAGGTPVLDGAAVELLEGKAGLDGKHKWIATTYGATTQFKVQAGSYRINVTQDYASGSADVEVKPGQASAVEVSINGGFLAATSDADATIEVYAGEKDISGKRTWIATDYNGQINKAFNAGPLHVVAKKPDGSVIAEKDVVVSAGQRTELTLP